jgi:8-oxo-dGTP pyrophosphatase MutT (NUDIX family)
MMSVEQGFPFQSVKAQIQAALALDLPYADRSQPLLEQQFKAQNSELKPAAVLVLCAFSREQLIGKLGPGDLSILYTLRTDKVETHRGQMAFPGGHCETEDQGDSARTALRETEEEVGIPQGSVQIVGQLPPLVTVTRFLVQPVVGILNGAHEEFALELNTHEIAEAFWLPFRELQKPGIYRGESIASHGVEYPIHVFQVEQYRIWGATGSMTRNFLDRLFPGSGA